MNSLPLLERWRVGLLLAVPGLVGGRRVGEVEDEHHVLVEHRGFDLNALGVAEQRKDSAVIVWK